MGAEWNKANRDKMRIATAKHRAKNKDKLNADARAVYKKNPEPDRAASLARYYANKERAREYSKQWARRNKEKIQAKATARRHADLEGHRAKERLQAGLPTPTRPCPKLCESCGKEPNGRYRILFLDHCHASGAFRGWLCNKCNIAFGLIGDNLEGVKALLEYAIRTSVHNNGSEDT
jgi:hypothetical protein